MTSSSNAGVDFEWREISIISGKATLPPNNNFASNVVITSQYAWWNFLPKNLFEQFHNPANVYFLFIAIMQSIDVISVTGGIPEMLISLGIIVFVSMVRAGIEDHHKHAADAKRNSAPYKILKGNKFVSSKSGSVHVGQIIKVEQNQMIPADMLLMGSSLRQGHCFLDRANLNGETKLEVMDSIPETMKYCNSHENKSDQEHNLGNLCAKLKYEPPNKRFDEFQGMLSVHKNENMDGAGEVQLDGTVLLMRETNLRNCDYIYGLVVYTGNDTKIQRSNMSGEKPKIKKSAVIQKAEHYQLIIFSIQFLFCFLGGVGAGVYNYLRTQDGSQNWYNPFEFTPWAEAVLLMFSWFQVLSQMVPISLVVSTEVIKFLTSKFIQRDPRLYYEPIKKHAKVNRSTLHEDLGQVEYIFSDKTGTLTQNKMEFRFLSIPSPDKRRSIEFGSKETQIFRAVKAKSKQQSTSNYIERTKTWTELEDDLNRNSSQNEFSKDDLEKLNNTLWPTRNDDIIQKNLRRFMLHMALSNTVKPFTKDDELQFQAECAEELAMVLFAQTAGYIKIWQNPSILQIIDNDDNVGEEQEEYQHLATFGFTSQRARVTVIYQKDEIIHVMTKGQDSVILPLINEDVHVINRLEQELHQLYSAGLRTLVCSFAEKSTAWWHKWESKYIELTSMVGETDEAAQHQLFADIEKDAHLQYLGTMGLEDRLQDLVPECIADFLHAGVKVWMITGDKLEAARNIAVACNLISPEMSKIFDPSYSLDDCVNAFQKSRLVMVTGKWASYINSEETLEGLFDILKHGSPDDGVPVNEFIKAYKLLNSPPEIQQALQELKDSEPLTRESFVQTMKNIKFPFSKAVEFDLQRGQEIFKHLESDATFSILINRKAFLQLFPELESEGSEIKEGNENNKATFFHLARHSKAVVFARALPIMKKKMVAEVMKRYPNVITLAVGDGANDTDMITTANIGVGIAGVEGTAAVNSADYALGTFRMLHTLLFVHGFWAYRRISFMINFLCYKALLFALPQIMFGIYSQFSSHRLWDSFSSFGYNIIYTSLPVICISLTDKMLSYETLQDNPVIYHSHKGKMFNMKVFMLWVSRAVLSSIYIWFLPYFTIDIESGVWYVSLLMFISSVTIVTITGMFEMHYITWPTIACYISYVGFWVFTPLVGLVPDSQIFGVTKMFTNSKFWLVFVLNVCFPIIIELLGRSLKIILRPTLITILRERYHKYINYKKGSVYGSLEKPILHRDDMKKWSDRKHTTDWDNKMADHKKDSDAEKHKDRDLAVKMMLHFRNMNLGMHRGTFESAAHHQYQKHDVFTPPPKIEEKDDSPVLKEGPLKKVSSLATKDIYFMLYADKCKYKKINDTRVKKISLRAITSITSAGKKQFEITVQITPHHSTSIIFEAAEKSLCESWMEALSIAINKVFSRGERVYIENDEGIKSGVIESEAKDGYYAVRVDGAKDAVRVVASSQLKKFPTHLNRVLVVKVFEGRDLIDMDIGSLSDPFLIIKVCDVKGKERYCKKTRVINNTLNPKFDVIKKIDGDFLQNDSTLTITVMDKDFLSSEFMGQMSWKIQTVCKRPIRGWFNLLPERKSSQKEKDLGKIRVYLSLQHKSVAHSLYGDTSTITNPTSKITGVVSPTTTTTTTDSPSNVAIHFEQKT